MSTPITMSDAEHEALQELLPWYASGALSEADAGRVQEHLRHCAVCREELTWQRSLLATESPLPAGLDPERALARLMPQLDVAATAQPVHLFARLQRWLQTTRWQGWALAGQFAVIVLLAVQLLPHHETPVYQALGRGAAATPDVLVVFRPDARLQDLQRILQLHGAQIIGGPTVTGAYMLEVEPDHQMPLLQALRAERSVEMAESLTAGSQP
ncbi:zf-HC2 domain-containing protein [Undibacterium sp. 14-3-2]|uniref:zf-HC2 domain-containing protein n=1 Tax=Undibacterium sp. 14-3-2 TaxID=2800129 RepID=UPI001905ACAD|nr:zf-HC2 domain-containing protein [Undibacterium sp. 14-3-2]MBK1890273.1 zf-HC2 domain-containing protein [Undibacterium sp. 14-3-2]